MKKKEKSFWEILKERLSPEVLKELLLLEKKRRGVEENRLVFIGTADVAQYWWCGMKSLFRNREMELAFFSAYLEDRILYSYELGLINQLPPDNESLLDIGNEITFQDIEKLLKKRAEEGIVKSYLLNPIPPPQNQEEAEEMSAEIPPEDWEIELPGLLEEGGVRTYVLHPFLSSKIKEELKEKAQKENRRVIEIKDLDPKQRGELMHLCLLGVYPTIRWNFKWDKYVVLSIPDGITEEFVYEFKTVRYKFLSLFEKPVALTQADLYGYFFKRKNKRVQIYICEDNEIQTFEEPVDTENAEETLHKFKQVEEGKLPKPPKSLKCRKCEFANICPLISKSSREM